MALYIQVFLLDVGHSVFKNPFLVFLSCLHVVACLSGHQVHAMLLEARRPWIPLELALEAVVTCPTDRS